MFAILLMGIEIHDIPTRSLSAELMPRIDGVINCMEQLGAGKWRRGAICRILRSARPP